MANKIISYFPKHKVYYEPFFGTGSIYFSKAQSKYSILNDLDSDVINLFLIVKDKKDDLIDLLTITPISEELFYYWMDNKESEPVKKALRFLYISAFSYLGKANTFRLIHNDCVHKRKLNKLIDICSRRMHNTMIRNTDFREFFKGIHVTDKHIGLKDRFIYADPPYIDTENNYETPKWTRQDLCDLFDTLQGTKIRFALSEFKNPFVVSEAKRRKLNIIDLGERRNIKNRKREVLITNYKSPYKIELYN